MTLTPPYGGVFGVVQEI